MLKAVALRLVGAIPVLVLVALGIFALLHLAPGDAATLLASEDARPEDVEYMRKLWGLDRPLVEQFGLFLSNAAQFEFGRSFRYAEEVTTLIGQRFPATIELAMVALLLATAVGVPLGIAAALRKGKLLDGLASMIAVGGVSAPSFWVGILLMLFFSAQVNWFPSSGRLPFGVDIEHHTGLLLLDSLIDGKFAAFPIVLQHLALPAITLALGMVGIIARITRSAMIDVGQEEWVYTAVAKGLSRRQIVRGHLLPNAAIPIVTIIGLELGVLISGSIVVEVVFGWPGVGFLLNQAVTVRDTPLVTGIVVTYTTLFIFINILVDILYVLVDPRLRAGRAV